MASQVYGRRVGGEGLATNRHGFQGRGEDGIGIAALGHLDIALLYY